MMGKFKEDLTFGCAPTLLTQFNSELPDDFAENYDLTPEEHTTHRVTSFNQVGIEDPFPAEPYEFEEAINEICYEPTIQPDTEKLRWSTLIVDESRMNMDHCSPYCLYIPSRQILLKLMRACIDVKIESDLWFNRIPEPASETS